MRLTITVLLAALAACVAPSHALGQTVLGTGTNPDAIVDREGVTHVVWDEQQRDSSDITHYCQIPRGGTACVNARSFAPKGDFGNLQDLFGPSVMITPFGEVLVLTHREQEVNGRQDPNLVFSSEDGGVTFTGPTVVGNLEPGDGGTGTGAIFDGADRRVITVTSSPVGVRFQAAPLGQYTTAVADLAPRVQARSTSVVQRARNSFVVAWVDSRVQVWVRTYTCTLDPCPLSHVNNPANWTPAVRVSEQRANQPRLATGPAGTFLLYRDGGYDDVVGEYRVRKLDGTTFGPPLPIGQNGNTLRDIAQDADGTLHVLFGEDDLGLTHVASRDGGATVGSPEVIAPRSAFVRSPRVIARTTDSGFTGLTFWEGDPGPDSTPPIFMKALPGASLPPIPTPPIDIPLPGGGGPQPQPGPAPTPACKLLAFAQLDIIAEGCIVKEGDTYIATGNLRINGLRVELGSGKMRFDVKKRTVTTSGATVTIKADSVVLYKAAINWKLPAGPSVSVGSVDVGNAGGKLLGFPLKGSAEVKFRGGGAEIPVHLGLPSLLGGVTADITIRADNVAGIHLRELHAKVGDALLGPLEIKNLTIDYDADAESWKGGATLILPPQPPGPSLAAEIGFSHGELDFLKNELTLPAPGIVLDPFGATYLKKIRFELATKPNLMLKGGISVTSGPTVGGVAAINIDGDLTLTLGKPVTLRVDGHVSVVNIPLASAYFELNTDGGVKFGGALDYKFAAFKANATIDGWADKRGFSAEANSRICIGDACQGGHVVISSVGFAGCAEFGPFSLGGGYKWGGTPALITGSCDLAPYRGDAAAAQARTVTVRSGGAVVAVSGAAAAPHATLAGPATLADTPGSATDTAFHADNTTYFIVRTPGTYQVQGEDITTVRVADVLPAPVITANVQRGRVLRYAVKPIPGQTVTFAEVGKGVARTIGKARGRRGTLRFTPASGPGGRRKIVALVSSYGKPRDELHVANYTPPRSATSAGRIKRLRARRAGSQLVATWAKTAGARRYEVRARLSDGRSVFVRQAGVRFRLKAVAKRTSATVSITPLQANGARGRTSTVKLRRR